LTSLIIGTILRGGLIQTKLTNIRVLLKISISIKKDTKMKVSYTLRKLNQSRFDHIIRSAVFVAVIVVVGAGYPVIKGHSTVGISNALTPSGQYTGHEGRNYQVVDTITGPQVPPTSNNGAWCNDIAYYDSYNGKFYLSDANNKQVDVVDTKTNKLLAPFGAGTFTGIGGCNNFDYSQQGPDGMTADSHGQLWVGSGDSTEHVFDADSGKQVAIVNTGGTLRADEQTFDERDNVIIVTNPDETTPFYSLINATTHKILGKYYVPGATGLEQPAWDATNDMVYMSVPSTTASPNGGEVAVLNPADLANPFVKALTIGSDCGPSGLAIDQARQLAALGCAGSAELMDLHSGEIVKTISQVIDTDEVWFNPSESRFYYGSYTYGDHQSALGVISSATRSFVTNVELGKNNFHSAAADSADNKVYVPIDGKGIVVYKAQ
jgi:hypothetical protein